MELKEFDFSKCRYNPLAKTFIATISKGIPAFAEYDKPNKKVVFRYVVALYDKESPIWYKEPEYFPRKVYAANITELAVILPNGGFNTSTMEILEGRNDDVNLLITAYLAHLGDMRYSMLINELTMYYGYTLRMTTPKMLDKSEYETLRLLAKNIEERTRSIFGSGKDDELTKVKTLLYERAEQDRLKLNPEAIVKMFEADGSLPKDWGRYGTKYQVDELKYVENDS